MLGFGKRKEEEQLLEYIFYAIVECSQERPWIVLDTTPDGFEVVVSAASDPREVLQIWMEHGGPTPVDPDEAERRRQRQRAALGDPQARHEALKLDMR